MTRRDGVLAAVLVLVALPAVVALANAVTFHLRNRSNGSIVSSGETREYLLYVPDSYDGAKPVPLVISLHGAGGWGALQRDVSRWNRVADEEGFLVVYPSGELSAVGRMWFEGRADGPERDARFISDLIDRLQSEYAIDPARIYANGFSNGGGMAFVLSCLIPERIAAVGMVGPALTLPFESCSDPSPMPLISFHGTADTATPYRGGTSWVGPGRFPDVRAWIALWARANGCTADPVDARVAADVTRRAWDGCSGGADVVLYTVEGGGHTWPGGEPLPEWFLGPTSDGIHATRTMWSFFLEHPSGNSEQDE